MSYPWQFQRDEIDVLEDEVEDLYDRHGRGDIVTLEAEVLQEQMDIQEQSDAELALRLGLRGINPMAPHVHEGHTHEEPEALRAWLADPSRTHPMYQYARLWALALREMAACGYETQTELQRDFFRIYADANLVPIKVYAGLCEGSHGDVLGVEVAVECLQLALVYVDRIQESLATLAQEAPFIAMVDRLRARGERLRPIIQRQAQELAHRHRLV